MGAVQERIVKVGHQECVWMGARGRAWWQWVAEGSRYEFVLLPVITGVVMGRESKQGCPLFLEQSVCFNKDVLWGQPAHRSGHPGTRKGGRGWCSAFHCL